VVAHFSPSQITFVLLEGCPFKSNLFLSLNNAQFLSKVFIKNLILVKSCSPDQKVANHMRESFILCKTSLKFGQVCKTIKKSSSLMVRSVVLFTYAAKSYFSIRLQIFLQAGCNFLPAEKLPPHAKNDECGFDVYKFGQEIFTIGTFCNFLY
jgi:hypothetical protein